MVALNSLVSIRWNSSTSSRKFYHVKNGWTSDFVKPTNYDMRKAQGFEPIVYPNGNVYYPDVPNAAPLHEFSSNGGIPSWSRPAANAAYEEFRDAALGSTSAVMTALAEWEDSADMITNRVSQLGRAAMALRQKSFPELLRAWRSKPHKRGSSGDRKAKKAASLWLEGSFGWLPLMGDVVNSFEQFAEPLPDTNYSGHRTDDYRRRVSTGGTFTYERYSVIRHSTGGRVVLSNPNLFIANQLGLINPLATAWELIPGSFVVDWLTDVGGMINSLSDFVGCSVTDTWRSHVLKRFEEVTILNSNQNRTVVRGIGSIRRTGLIKPMANLEVRKNFGNSLMRCANATALAVQLWKSPTKIG